MLGASLPTIVRLLSKNFLILVAIAMGLSWPIAYWIMRKWLASFAYKIQLSADLFAFAGMIAIAVTVLTVGQQATKVARSNPIDALKYE
ncbi:hypothetical protein KAR48_20100 [bacterium]|nr:hypothetical protein [bacterium]